MPKYKEIKINLQVSPEVILGNAIREMIAASAQQNVKCDTKEENKQK